MEVNIIDFEIIEINGINSNRVHLEIDGDKRITVLLSENEIINTNAAEQAIRKLLNGNDIVGHTFTV